MHLSRALLVILAAAALVAAAVGCGSDSSSSTEGPKTSASATTPQTAGEETTTTTPSKKPSGASGAKQGGGPSQSQQAPASRPQEVAKATSEEEESADQSIQEYGSEAGESEESEVVEAMRGFVKDLAASDYAGVCQDLSSSVRRQLEAFTQAQKSSEKPSCPQFLQKMIRNPEKDKAKRILAGVVTRVRVTDKNAFLLVKPQGEPVSYFVFSHEEDAWKPTSIALGTPLLP